MKQPPAALAAAAAAATTGESIPRPKDAPAPSRPVPTVSADDALRAMMEAWQVGPTPALSTGLRQLDALLAGGLRRKSFVAMTGAAKSGKTSLFDQVTFDAVRSGNEARASWDALAAEQRRGPRPPEAFGLVLSTEMGVEETIARWLARAAFLARLAERSPDPDGCVGFGGVQTGEAWQDPAKRAAIALAAEQIRPTLARLAAERLRPLSTVATVAERIARARERWPDSLPVVFLDPLQRLLPDGPRADRMEETERVSLVATQVFDLAEREGLAVLAALDTTKAGAVGASSATAARGSYIVNHAATTVLGFHRSGDETDGAHWSGKLQSLAERLTRDGGAAEGEEAAALAEWIAARVPRRSWEHPDASSLGRRAVYLECSGNRAGPARPCAFGAIPGAAAFTEADTDLDSLATTFRAAPPSDPGPPAPRRGKGARS